MNNKRKTKIGAGLVGVVALGSLIAAILTACTPAAVPTLEPPATIAPSPIPTEIPATPTRPEPTATLVPTLAPTKTPAPTQTLAPSQTPTLAPTIINTLPPQPTQAPAKVNTLPSAPTQPPVIVQATQPPAPAGCPSGCVSSSPTCQIKGNISDKGDKIYHVPGGASYKATVIDPTKGERWFCTDAEAQSNGWRRAAK